MSRRWTFVRTLPNGPNGSSVEREDDGMALIANFEGSSSWEMLVRVHSWDETRVHKEFCNLLGKRVRVTVEVLD